MSTIDWLTGVSCDPQRTDAERAAARTLLPIAPRPAAEKPLPPVDSNAEWVKKFRIEFARMTGGQP